MNSYALTLLLALAFCACSYAERPFESWNKHRGNLDLATIKGPALANVLQSAGSPEIKINGQVLNDSNLLDLTPAGLQYLTDAIHMVEFERLPEAVAHVCGWTPEIGERYAIVRKILAAKAAGKNAIDRQEEARKQNALAAGHHYFRSYEADHWRWECVVPVAPKIEEEIRAKAEQENVKYPSLMKSQIASETLFYQRLHALEVLGVEELSDGTVADIMRVALAKASYRRAFDVAKKIASDFGVDIDPELKEETKAGSDFYRHIFEPKVRQ